MAPLPAYWWRFWCPGSMSRPEKAAVADLVYHGRWLGPGSVRTGQASAAWLRSREAFYRLLTRTHGIHRDRGWQKVSHRREGAAMDGVGGGGGAGIHPMRYVAASVESSEVVPLGVLFGQQQQQPE